MLLNEFDNHNSLKVKLSSIVSHIRSRREDSGAKKPITVKSFINVLRDNDIYVNRNELLDMIKSAPLKNIIHDIKGDDILFKGDVIDRRSDSDRDKQQDTVEKMASRAATR